MREMKSYSRLGSAQLAGRLPVYTRLNLVLGRHSSHLIRIYLVCLKIYDPGGLVPWT